MGKLGASEANREWIEGGGVRGDGFIVKSGFNFAVYREGDSVVKLAIRRGFRGGNHLIVLPEDAFRRFEGSSHDNSPVDRERMRANFVAAMEFAGSLVERHRYCKEMMRPLLGDAIIKGHVRNGSMALRSP